MSKGNSRKGNREVKKPKKESAKVLATAVFSTKPAELKLGSRKAK
jgi:hypothetical protein